jgi:hypothetical protein
MNKKKIGLLVTIFSMIIFGFVFFSFKKEDNKIINNISADWIDHYSDFNSMASAADLIIKGKKVDSYQEQRVDLIFTKQIIEIRKIYKGELNVDDKIEILQTGGTLNNITTLPFEEAQLLDNNCNYLLLLRKTSEGHYLILGGYQGVGLINDNENVVFNDANTEISSELKTKKLKDLEEILTNE